jgi:hypothetical protein
MINLLLKFKDPFVVRDDLRSSRVENRFPQSHTSHAENDFPGHKQRGKRFPLKQRGKSFPTVHGKRFPQSRFSSVLRTISPIIHKALRKITF